MGFMDQMNHVNQMKINIKENKITEKDEQIDVL